MPEKKFEELNLKDAFLFAAALQNQETCRLILELILDQPVPKVNVHTEHALLYNSDFRSVRLDVYADVYRKNELQVGYNLEMQNDGKHLLPKRARFYQAEIDAGALGPGEDFDLLRSSYIIFICTFDPFDRKLYRYTFEERCLELEMPLGDGTRKIFLNTKGKNDGEVPAALADFLHYVERSNDACVSEIRDQRIHRLHEQIKVLKKSREWRSQYMRFEELQKRSEEKGRAEGEANATKRMQALIAEMAAAGETDQIARLGTDETFLSRMFEKYGL